MVDEQVATTSFSVTLTENGKTYRRNRRQLIKLKDQHLGRTSDQQPLELELNPEDSTQPALPEEVTLNQDQRVRWREKRIQQKAARRARKKSKAKGQKIAGYHRRKESNHVGLKGHLRALPTEIISPVK